MDNYEYTELLKTLQIKMNNITNVIKPQEIQIQLKEIEELENTQEFWADSQNATKISKEKIVLQRKLQKYNTTLQALNDAQELYEIAKIDNDEESLQELFLDSSNLQNYIGKIEIDLLLSEKTDINNAIVIIHPGAGGTESQDWAAMLLRMYTRWAERHNFKVQILDFQNGEEAGIKDASILISGENAYGYLKVENGIHRLVRISPFDSNAKRHTSFSSVLVSPEIDDDIDIQIEDKDIRIDTYRSSGAGGQHVNKTESAIRITHLATNIVVQCQNDRSQHKNKATAMKMLKSRLYEYELAKQKAIEDGKEKSEIGWGHQIRSYVLQPYQQVKDTRSHEAFSNVSAILDGDIDKLIEGVLISNKTQD